MKLKRDITWAGRREVVRASLIASLGLLLYSMYLGHEMAAVVFPSIAPTAGGIIGFYVFGSAWERVRGIPSQTKEIDADSHNP